MKKRKLGERYGYIFIVSVFLIILNVTLGYMLMRQSQNAVVTQMQGRMLDIANSAADMLDGDEMKSLTGDDENTEAYQRGLKTLSGFQNNIQLKYIYCINVSEDGKFSFSIDPSDDPGVFGESIKYTDALYEASQGTASVDKVPYEDRWGKFYSAYSPVFGSDGKVAVIVAVDFSSDWYDRQVNEQTFTVLFICALSVLFGALIVFILTGRTRKRNRVLFNQLNDLADNVEDLVSVVEDTTHSEQTDVHFEKDGKKDDIRDLSDKIRSMQDTLRLEIASVHRMAYVDALTGVRNKTAYLEAIQRLNREIEEGRAEFSVATFDMNGLKQINDNYGHECGDLALIDEANILSSAVGKENVYRIGGDEFIMILPTHSEQELDRLFGEIDSKIELENSGEKQYKNPLSLSKGYSIFNKDTDTEYKFVFRRADDAMYRDKKAYYERKANNK